MNTARIQKVAVTFECINCNLVVTEKMHKLQAEMVGQSGGCCDACCNHAENYFDGAEYQAFEEAEENFDYYA